MSKIRIVIAEDHTVVREGTRSLLEREEDFEVVGEAGDGEQALELISRLQPDVAIIDISMPKLNGIEVTKEVKKLYPGIAVLILTAYDNDQYVFALLEAGAAGYLLKTVRGHEVVEAVRAVRAGESVLHPAIARKVVTRYFPKPTGNEAGQPDELLSEREMEVLKLAARGLSNKEIADDLVLSVRTVQTHLGNIFNKLKVGSRTEAVLHGLRKGWFSLEETSA